MSQITITINADSPEELNRVLAMLGSASGSARTEPKAEAEPKAAPKSASKAADKPKAEEPKEEPAGDGPTLDDCKAAMKTFLDANDRDALTELLGRFGIRNISALPTAQYGEFIAACAG